MYARRVCRRYPSGRRRSAALRESRDSFESISHGDSFVHSFLIICRYEQTRGYRLIAGNECKAGVYVSHHQSINSFPAYLTCANSHAVLAPLVLPCRSFTTAGFITTFIIVIIAVVSALFCAFKFQTGRNPQSVQDVIDLVCVATSLARTPSSHALHALVFII